MNNQRYAWSITCIEGASGVHGSKPHDIMKMKRFAVRIEEGARAHFKIVNAEGPDQAAIAVIDQLDGSGDRLLGAKIAVWEHGTLQRSHSPLFIKSIRPFETTPDINVVQAIREEYRRARWNNTKELAERERKRKSHQFEEPYEHWLETHYDGEGREFFSLSLEARRECIELRDHLKHVSPGQMTEIQARFAGVVSGYRDLYRYEMHTIQTNLLTTLEMIHQHHAGTSELVHSAGNESTQRDRLASLIGSKGDGHQLKAEPVAH
jgi:hypothetical protein